VLIDENYAADPRTYTKDMFLGQYGVNETMIASGDWPFLTDGRERLKNLLGTIRETYKRHAGNIQ